MIRIITLAAVGLLGFGCAMGADKQFEDLTPEEQEFCEKQAPLMLHDLEAPKMGSNTATEDLANALDPLHFVADNVVVEPTSGQDAPPPGSTMDGVEPVSEYDDFIDKEITTEVDMVNATYLQWHIVCP